MPENEKSFIEQEELKMDRRQFFKVSAKIWLHHRSRSGCWKFIDVGKCSGSDRERRKRAQKECEIHHVPCYGLYHWCIPQLSDHVVGFQGKCTEHDQRSGVCEVGPGRTVGSRRCAGSKSPAGYDSGCPALPQQFCSLRASCRFNQSSLFLRSQSEVHQPCFLPQ